MPDARQLAVIAILGLAGCTAGADAPSAASGAAALRYIALGTEPFWSVEVLPGSLRYSTPEDIGGATFAATHRSAGRRMVYSGTLKAAPFVLSIEPGQCSDGMSDTVYAWRARVTHGALVLDGCAREAVR